MGLIHCSYMPATTCTQSQTAGNFGQQASGTGAAQRCASCQAIKVSHLGAAKLACALVASQLVDCCHLGVTLFTLRCNAQRCHEVTPITKTCLAWFTHNWNSLISKLHGVDPASTIYRSQQRAYVKDLK